MTRVATDPYRALGVSSTVSDEELRRAYRRLVQRHHPDHNGGSAESARRFEEVQAAYAEIRDRRRVAGARRTTTAAGTENFDERLAQLEYELREAQRARERRLREAREQRERIQAARERRVQEAERARLAREAGRSADAAQAAQRDARAATDEELGYVSTDDSFGAILRDARDELTERFSHAREHPVVKRVSDLIDGLDGLASQLDGRDRDRNRKSRRP